MNLEPYIRNVSLKGLDAQVKWATQLRKKKIEEIKKMGFRAFTLAVKPHVSQQDLDSIKCDSVAKTRKLVWWIGHLLITRPDATWWIAHRDEKVHEWIPEAAKATIAHIKKHRLAL